MVHLSKQNEYVCMQCNIVICADCAIVGAHRTHPTNNIANAYLALKDKFAENYPYYEEILKIEKNSKESKINSTPSFPLYPLDEDRLLLQINP